MSWAGLAAILLGYLILKAIFDPETKIYRCPTCNLVVKKFSRQCLRCKTSLEW